MMSKRNNRIKSVINEIQELSGLHLFTNTRQREHVEIRSLLYVILKNHYNFTYREILALCSEYDYHITHASVIHSINSFPIYSKYNTRLEEWYHALLIDLDDDIAEQRIDFIKPKLKYLSEQDLLKLSTIVKEMYEEAIIKLKE
tara:strand:- start:244 stop:675 length:432 start_codon:yes stop_codon:yes gene_type:complete